MINKQLFGFLLLSCFLQLLSMGNNQQPTYFDYLPPDLLYELNAQLIHQPQMSGENAEAIKYIFRHLKPDQQKARMLAGNYLYYCKKNLLCRFEYLSHLDKGTGNNAMKDAYKKYVRIQEKLKRLIANSEVENFKAYLLKKIGFDKKLLLPKDLLMRTIDLKEVIDDVQYRNDQNVTRYWRSENHLKNVLGVCFLWVMCFPIWRISNMQKACMANDLKTSVSNITQYRNIPYIPVGTYLNELIFAGSIAAMVLFPFLCLHLENYLQSRKIRPIPQKIKDVAHEYQIHMLDRFQK